MKTMRMINTIKPGALLIAAVLAGWAAPLAAGEILIPLSANVAADGTTYSTQVWIANTGTTPRRWTYSLIAPGADGTKAPAGRSITVGAGAVVPVTGLAPAGKNGMLLTSGAPQLAVTTRLEAAGKDGALRASVAGPLVGGGEVAPARATLHLHGLSHKPGGLITDLYLVNASRQATRCTLDALRADGSSITRGVPYTLPPLSLRVVEGALAALGAADIDEARFAVSCDQPFYAYARVYKPGSAELNVMTPAQSLGG
jgi:hypothetical protein